ncbi:hypothetical protein DY000_02021208 [Brassica cretica]|uniref:Uncharacterized protein n=2 Tax=Brassica cretica TaxID=69181 RepID=A0ABQ7E1P9_BRACR|nr:hypothetical protein DY000_02021208 [Brassica cretica]
MSGNTKEKIAVRNNAGKKTPAATAPMANAYANATVLEKIENLAATFRHRKCNETSSRFLFLNIKGNDKSYQTLKRNKSITHLGRYVATEQAHGSVATQRPSSSQARALRSDRARTQLGRDVATELQPSSVAT